MQHVPPSPAAQPLAVRTAAIALFVALWLGLQVGLPLWKRLQPHQQRFGWQMYSGWRAAATQTRAMEFVGERTDGQRVPLSRTHYLVRYRPEISGSYVERLTAHICGIEPSLRSVEAVWSRRVVYRHSCVVRSP